MGYLDPGLTIALVCGTLVVFAAFVALSGKVTIQKCLYPDEQYLSARSSVGWVSLGFSFYASCVGSWVLFAPPELGALFGGWAVILYAVGVSGSMLLMAFLGPTIRNHVGEKGFAVSDFVLLRYGRCCHLWMCAVALFAMWITLAGELAFIGRAIVVVSPDVNPVAVIVPVTFATLVYTAYAGLSASIRTDVLQGIMVCILALAACAAAFINAPWPPDQENEIDLWTKEGVISGLVMILSFIPAFLIDQGAWQRVWAGRTVRDVRWGFVLSAALIVPTLILFGAAGIVSSAVTGPVSPEDAGNAFFTLILPLHDVWVGLIVVMALALVASSVDTLQNAMPALIGTDLVVNKISVNWARLFTVILNIPAVCVALFWSGEAT
eukprot:GHVQ01001518.1.p1 GENE.GHVQ01001518.1~~GHVQ01001518.1.p1  ORF type:complete len:380 (-),score=31.44 GHVQ01001518.1:75-1214(-)